MLLLLLLLLSISRLSALRQNPTWKGASIRAQHYPYSLEEDSVDFGFVPDVSAFMVRANMVWGAHEVDAVDLGATMGEISLALPD